MVVCVGSFVGVGGVLVPMLTYIYIYIYIYIYTNCTTNYNIHILEPSHLVNSVHFYINYITNPHINIIQHTNLLTDPDWATDIYLRIRNV